MDAEQGLRAMHLFAGSGGGILGGLLCGWRTVCAVEIDQYCREVLVARQNDGSLDPFPIWDDVRTFDGTQFAGKVDVVAGGFPCFVAGSLVLTESGYKPIETVSVGERVLTHAGNWRSVTAVMQKDGAETGIVSGFGILDTQCTPNHRYHTPSEAGDGWTEAKKLKKGQELSITLPDEEPDDHSTAWWYLCGRYLADGWRVRRKGRRYGRVVICCNGDKLERLSRAVDEAGYHATVSKERTVYKLHICRGELYRDLEQFGHGAGGKTIPRSALCLPRDKAAALVAGYLDGDGGFTQSGFRRASSISPGLILGMQLVSVRAGFPLPSVFYTAREKTCVIEGRTCNQHDTYTLQWATTPHDCRSRWRRMGSTILRKCYGYKTCDGRERVYNLSVEGDESYVVNGAAVHNCQNVSPLGRREGIRGDKSCLWCEMARIAGEVRPTWVFAENSSDLVKLGLDVVLQDLDALGYDATWMCLSAAELGAPHIRDRIWILGRAREAAAAEGEGCPVCGHRPAGRSTVHPPTAETVRVLSDAYLQRRQELRLRLPAQEGVYPLELQGEDVYGRHRGGDGVQARTWPYEPQLPRVAHGIPFQLEQLRGYGNAQVPVVAARAFCDLAARFG